MRALHRHDLDEELLDYLRRMQDRLDGGEDLPVVLWQKQRQTKDIEKILGVLRAMAGRRERCMYCQDSLGGAVDHFWPQTPYPEKVFQWTNFLWACSRCNGYKGDRFPLDRAGQPLLIDPTVVDPWDFLVYSAETGELTARWDQTGELAKGVSTLEVLSTLRLEAVTEGRRRTRRRLARSVREFLGAQKPPSDPSEPDVVQLLEEIGDTDDHGLSIWYFLKDGREEAPFGEVRRTYPVVWTRIGQQLSL